MADYSSIKGNRIQYLSSDPTLDSNSEGQVWYNSTTGSLKGLVQIKAWSSGGNLGTARRAFDGGSGTQTAALIAGGQGPALPTYNSATEEYSGFAWSAGGNLNTARSELAAAGTQTSTVAFAGEVAGVGVTSVTEEYNGSSWTNSNPVNTARRQIASSGTQTAALMFAGAEPAASNKTESYDGTSWTALPGTTNIARASFGGDGTQTAAMAVGGPSTTTEKWDGTSWSNDASLNRSIDGSNIYVGTTSHGITAGGREPPGTTLVSATEEYDSVSFSQTSATLSTARRELSGAGNGTSALAFGGYNNSTVLANTEEYFSDIANYSASSQDAWVSGGNMNTAVSEMGGSGTQTAALAVGGGGGGNTEEYNGTSWSDSPDSPITAYVAAFGTQTATITATGSPNTASAIYNGTSWTSGPSLNSAQSNAAGAGILTSGIIAGGNSPPPRTSQVQSYNGTAWSSETSLPAAKGNLWGAGSGETSALMMGGGNSTGPLTPNTLEYDGSTWTAGSNMPSGRESGMGGGLQTAALYAGGNAGTGPPSNTNATILYNGTSWTSSANLASSRSAGGGATNNPGNTTGLVFAGNNPSPANVTATEEFSSGAPASPTGVAASTITTS